MAGAAVRARRRLRRAVQRRRVQIAPPAILAIMYAGLIGLGTLALKTPWAAHDPLGWGDAAFTATSAVTVTGLSVVDAGVELTGFGQGVLLALIQLGGLGLMTFAALALSMIGVPLNIAHRVFLREDLNQTSITDLMALVRVILQVALACEILGAAALALVFVPEFGWRDGIWQAAFHSVSAFNNAGLSLQSDSLTRWVGDPVVNLVIPALFIFGGIGFVVLAELREQRRWRKFSLHTKLMLVGTGALILWSCLGFAALEWSNPRTLGGLEDPGARIWASWLQGVTTRTAGFNSVDIGGIHDSTAMMFMSLMVIGGGSTSTAGGIKVTTFLVLILATIAFFRRSERIEIFGRSLGAQEAMKVLAVAMTSILAVFTAIFVISISHDGDFLDLAFEVTSAFGTVGLSRGATAELDGTGRAAIMAMMFIGRVGPLTLGFFMASKTRPLVRRPPGRIYLG